MPHSLDYNITEAEYSASGEPDRALVYAVLALVQVALSIDKRLAQYATLFAPDTRPVNVTRLPSPNAEDEAVARGVTHNIEVRPDFSLAAKDEQILGDEEN